MSTWAPTVILFYKGHRILFLHWGYVGCKNIHWDVFGILESRTISERPLITHSKSHYCLENDWVSITIKKTYTLALIIDFQFMEISTFRWILLRWIYHFQAYMIRSMLDHIIQNYLSSLHKFVCLFVIPSKLHLCINMETQG
jgi:hypothetical protein